MGEKIRLVVDLELPADLQETKNIEHRVQGLQLMINDSLESENCRILNYNSIRLGKKVCLVYFIKAGRKKTAHEYVEGIEWDHEKAKNIITSKYPGAEIVDVVDITMY